MEQGAMEGTTTGPEAKVSEVPSLSQTGVVQPDVPRSDVVAYPSSDAAGPGSRPRRWLIPLMAIGLVAVLVVSATLMGWSVGTDDSSGMVDLLGSNVYNATYEWSYNRQTYAIALEINGSSYNAYKSEERTSDYASYVTSDDGTVVALSAMLHNMTEANNLSDLESAQFVLAFVQSLPYTDDEETTGMAEYPRFPVETLVDYGGDCEDKAALYASLVQAEPFGYDAVLIELMGQDGVGHMATGIWASGLHGTYYTYMGRTYYYCETTSAGWSIGEMSSDLRGYQTTILPC